MQSGWRIDFRQSYRHCPAVFLRLQCVPIHVRARWIPGQLMLYRLLPSKHCFKALRPPNFFGTLKSLGNICRHLMLPCSEHPAETCQEPYCSAAHDRGEVHCSSQHWSSYCESSSVRNLSAVDAVSTSCCIPNSYDISFSPQEMAHARAPESVPHGHIAPLQAGCERPSADKEARAAWIPGLPICGVPDLLARKVVPARRSSAKCPLAGAVAHFRTCKVEAFSCCVICLHCHPTLISVT